MRGKIRREDEWKKDEGECRRGRWKMTGRKMREKEEGGI